jgi:hypothetical protein
VLLRTVLSFVNLGVLTATLFVWFELPLYSDYALYACLAWVLAAFAVMYSRWGDRRIGSAAAPASSGPPLATSPGSASLGFCIFCAAILPPGVPRCPECGRAIGPG